MKSPLTQMLSDILSDFPIPPDSYIMAEMVEEHLRTIVPPAPQGLSKEIAMFAVTVLLLFNISKKLDQQGYTQLKLENMLDDLEKNKPN